MTIGFIFRHPALAFNRRFVCSYWGHDTRGGTYTADSHNVVTLAVPVRCVRCQEIV